MDALCDVWEAVGTQDLFTVGIALDISGAWLLATGLLASPKDMVAGGLDGTAGAYSPEQIKRRSYDRVDALFGMGALICGFSLQAVGYLLQIARAGGQDFGWLEAGVAMALGVLAALLVLLSHRRLRLRLFKKTVVKVAFLYGKGSWKVNSTRMLIQVAKNADLYQPGPGPEDDVEDLPLAARRRVVEQVYGIDIADHRWTDRGGWGASS